MIAITTSLRHTATDTLIASSRIDTWGTATSIAHPALECGITVPSSLAAQPAEQHFFSGRIRALDQKDVHIAGH
jgi:hypothetical protein